MSVGWVHFSTRAPAVCVCWLMCVRLQVCGYVWCVCVWWCVWRAHLREQVIVASSTDEIWCRVNWLVDFSAPEHANIDFMSFYDLILLFLLLVTRDFLTQKSTKIEKMTYLHSHALQNQMFLGGKMGTNPCLLNQQIITDGFGSSNVEHPEIKSASNIDFHDKVDQSHISKNSEFLISLPNILGATDQFQEYVTAPVPPARLLSLNRSLTCAVSQNNNTQQKLWLILRCVGWRHQTTQCYLAPLHPSAQCFQITPLCYWVRDGFVGPKVRHPTKSNLC